MLPKGVDPEVQSCLAQALDEAVNSETFGQLMENFDNQPLNLGPEGLNDVISRSAQNYEKVLSEL